MVIGKVLTCEPHPNSDHMHITTVDLGQGDPVQIVCGASNVAAGQKVVVATLGTKLYDRRRVFHHKEIETPGRGIERHDLCRRRNRQSEPATRALSCCPMTWCRARLPRITTT